jgi:hypothetical protein
MNVLIFSILFCLFLLVFCQPPPVPPKGFPPDWHSWVLTSIKRGTELLWAKGQIITYVSSSQYSCRYDQQDLVNPSPLRAKDYCDYTDGDRFSVGYDEDCDLLDCPTSVSAILYNPNITSVAKFLGIDIVNNRQCFHFFSDDVFNPVDGSVIDVNLWTDISTTWPCEISMVDYPLNYTYTWAFDGFSDRIPTNNIDYSKCIQAKEICIQQDYVCRAIPTANESQLGAALSWVCNPSILDCSPIQPGGKYYYPNTLLDHCNWAFDAYYQIHKDSQGAGACYFGGVAHLVPPTQKRSLDQTWPIPFFSLDLVCHH